MIQLRTAFLKSSSLRLISTSGRLRKDGDDSKSDAINKLNSLLADLTKQKPKEKVASKIDLAKPKQLKTKNVPKEEKVEEPTDLAGKLEVAAKKVADTIGGDTKKTELELLNLLLAYQKDPTGESKSTPTPVLSDLISGMKVERTSPEVRRGEAREMGRAGEVRQALKGKAPMAPRVARSPSDQAPQRVDLWSEPSGLGIFTPDKTEDYSPGPRLATWSTLHARDLKLSVTHPPSNIFEQMILWTDQGKLWHFPIDNEQGLDAEARVDFSQHVFLDSHLEPWCPPLGPIRAFMQLVLVGLSKNPYYTVEEKVQHILWFRDYFASKNALLERLEMPPIQGGDPAFNLDVDQDFRRWGREIIRVRKDW